MKGGMVWFSSMWNMCVRVASHAWKAFRLSQCDTFMNKRHEIGVTEMNRGGQNLSIHLFLSLRDKSITPSALKQATIMFYSTQNPERLHCVVYFTELCRAEQADGLAAQSTEEKTNKTNKKTAQTKTLLQQRSVKTPRSPAALSLCSRPPRSPRSESIFDARCCMNSNMCSSSSQCGCAVQWGSEHRKASQEKPWSLRATASTAAEACFENFTDPI